jgi:transposase
MRYELSDDEWTTIGPMLPNKARGVPPVDDRRALNGIFWVLRSGAPWRDLPSASVPPHFLRTALCAGDAPGSGAGSWTRSPVPMMPPSK